MAFSTLTISCNCHLYLVSKHFDHPKTNPQTHSAAALRSSSPHTAPVNHQSASVSILSPIPDISYTCNHTRCDLFCVISFTLHHAFKHYPNCSMCQYFIFFQFHFFSYLRDRMNRGSGRGRENLKLEIKTGANAKSWVLIWPCHPSAPVMILIRYFGFWAEGYSSWRLQ